MRVTSTTVKINYLNPNIIECHLMKPDGVHFLLYSFINKATNNVELFIQEALHIKN